MTSSNTSPQLLTTALEESDLVSELGDVQCEKFYETKPAESDARGRTWYVRGQNFVISYSETQPGAVLERQRQEDEYIILVPDAENPADIVSSGERRNIPGFSLCIIPPGDSRISLPKGGRILRVFSCRSEDLLAKCSNAAAYAKPHPNLPPYEAWPKPRGGHAIRPYSLDVPPKEGRVGRIFVCSSVMVNYANVRKGRSNGILSPHSHDAFEQASLVLDGTFTHHLRWPWTRRKAAWREDEHDFARAPSISIAPARVIHTAEAMGDGDNQLVDVWAPPRVDYYQRGFVLNAQDYQMP